MYTGSTAGFGVDVGPQRSTRFRRRRLRHSNRLRAETSGLSAASVRSAHSTAPVGRTADPPPAATKQITVGHWRTVHADCEGKNEYFCFEYSIFIRSVAPVNIRRIALALIAVVGVLGSPNKGFR